MSGRVEFNFAGFARIKPYNLRDKNLTRYSHIWELFDVITVNGKHSNHNDTVSVKR